MVKFSKWVAVAAAIVLVLSLVLSGCGQKSEDNTAASTQAPESSQAVETSQAASSAATDVSSLPEVKLIWYFPGQWPHPDQDEIFAKANELIKAKINATVDFKPFSFNDYPTKMQTVIASQEKYDLCFTSDWLNNYVQNVSKGAFLPLDDLLTKYAPNAYAAIPPKMWDAARIKGKIYGFLNYQISARTPDVIVYKADADKYNFDLKSLSGKIKADTLNLLEPFVSACVKDNPQKAFYTMLSELGGTFFDVDAVGGWNVPGAVAFSDSSLKVVNQFELDSYKTFAKTMREWNAKGYLDSKSRISTNRDDWWPLAKAGKVGMLIGGTYKPGVEAVNSENGGAPMIDIPCGTAYLTTTGIIATMHAISRSSENPERAMMLLEAVNTDKDIYNTLVFGIQGKHYELDSEGYLTRLGTGNNIYNPNVDWMFGTNFLAYIQKGQPKTVWDDTKALNESATPSPLLGFSFDPEPVKAEIGRCTTVVGEYARGIELGVSSEAKYDEFLAKLKTAGADKIITEMQNQINAWKASK